MVQSSIIIENANFLCSYKTLRIAAVSPIRLAALRYLSNEKKDSTD